MAAKEIADEQKARVGSLKDKENQTCRAQGSAAVWICCDQPIGDHSIYMRPVVSKLAPV